MYSVQADGYWVGFADLTIGDVIEYYPDFFLGFSILVTCLDSSTELRRYGESVQSNRREWAIRIIDESLWIDATHVKDFLASTHGFLTHFDELCLLEGLPPAQMAIPKIFTSERAPFSEGVPASFLQTFQSFKATRYLSDGCGLNFACENSAIAQRLTRIESEIAESAAPD